MGTVDTTTTAFRRSLTAPGVLDFLTAANFLPHADRRGLLALNCYDPAVFYLGISALERVQRESPEYARDKALRSFRRELRSFLDSRTDGEAEARNRFLSTLPSEPKSGGSRITVEFGVAAKNNNSDFISSCGNADDVKDDERVRPAKISRGFDHDDTLGDVVNWLGGAACSVMRSKLVKGEWRLVNVNEKGALEDCGTAASMFQPSSTKHFSGWAAFRRDDLRLCLNFRLDMRGPWISRRMIPHRRVPKKNKIDEAGY